MAAVDSHGSNSRQISINASCSLDEIMSARKEGQKVFFQVSDPLLHPVARAHDNETSMRRLMADLPEQRPQSLGGIAQARDGLQSRRGDLHGGHGVEV